MKKNSAITHKYNNKQEFIKPIFRAITGAIKHCHDANISHRDIKMDNILVNDEAQIKIIDFGFAVKRNSPQELISNYCGTPSFMCPEIIKRVPYDPHKADIWALGVLLYRLCTDRYPFRGENDSELSALIVKGELKFDKNVCEKLKELLEGMMCKSEAQRLNAHDVLQSEWLRE